MGFILKLLGVVLVGLAGFVIGITCCASSLWSVLTEEERAVVKQRVNKL